MSITVNPALAACSAAAARAAHSSRSEGAPGVESGRAGAECGRELAAAGLSVRDPRSRWRLSLGDPLTVRVEGVDAFHGHIALGPIAADQSSEASAASTSAPRRSHSR